MLWAERLRVQFLASWVFTWFPWTCAVSWLKTGGVSGGHRRTTTQEITKCLYLIKRLNDHDGLQLWTRYWSCCFMPFAGPLPFLPLCLLLPWPNALPSNPSSPGLHRSRMGTHRRVVLKGERSDHLEKKTNQTKPKETHGKSLERQKQGTGGG